MVLDDWILTLYIQEHLERIRTYNFEQTSSEDEES